MRSPNTSLEGTVEWEGNSSRSRIYRMSRIFTINTIDRIKKTLSDASFLILSRIFTINTICRIKEEHVGETLS